MLRKTLILFIASMALILGFSALSLDTEELDSSLESSEDLSQDSLEDLLEETTGERERFIIEINPSLYSSQVLEDAGVNIRYEYRIIEGVAVEAPPDAVNILEQLDFVENVRPDLDTELPVLDGESSEGEAESYSGGEDRVVAVLDTGIDDSHIDLEGEVVDHRDFTGTGSEDRHGHGTHVAGISSGTGDGNSEYIGVAPDSSLMNVKVLRDDGSGSSSDAIRGIEYAVDNNADVIVMSLGVRTDCDGSDPLSQAADNAVSEGVPVIVSAGNDGPESETITSPGCARNVFTIGASGNENVASFSSRGPTSDGQVKPDIVAPGVNIMAAEAGTQDRYTSKSGTSMSAPYVGGAVTLLMGEYDGSPEDYYEALSETAYTLNEDRYTEGDGQINITAALNYWNNNENRESEDSEDFESGQDTDRPTEEDRQKAEQHENVGEVDESPRQETRDNRDYWIYRGIDNEGKHINVRVDRETGETTVERPEDYRALINLLFTLRDNLQEFLSSYL